MPMFPKLDPTLAALVKTLFPLGKEHSDPLLLFQQWETQPTELSREQIDRTVSAIRDYAIPRTEASAARSPAGPLRDDRKKVLSQWREIEAMLTNPRPRCGKCGAILLPPPEPTQEAWACRACGALHMPPLTYP